MDQQRFDRWTRQLANRLTRRQAAIAVATCNLGAAAAMGEAHFVEAAGCCTKDCVGCACRQNSCLCKKCSCVHFVRCQTKISGGLEQAADYTEKQMLKRGYVRTTANHGRYAGAIMVWDRNVKGALGAGHMGILLPKTKYNDRKKVWEISVRHSNWGGKCDVIDDDFTWKDLKGVSIYVKDRVTHT